MKRIFIVCIVILMFVCIGNTQDFDYITKPETIPVPTEVTTPQPPVSDVEVLDFVRSVTVQVVVRFNQYTRYPNWYKLAEGEKLDKPFLQDEEKEWYEQGYKVEWGKWQEPEPWLISGSGVILYSKEYEKPILINNKLEYGETLGITNWHVVEMLIDYESRGNASKPLNIYAEKDKVVTMLPPSVTIIDGARPVKQVYYTVDTQQIYIKHDEKQLYEVVAELVSFDNFIDVAVFRIKNVFGLPYATWRGTPCQVGEKVWICGAPLGVRFSIDRGYINQTGLDLGISGGVGWDDQVKMDIAAAPGSSGSGIFDIYGNLIAQEHGVFVYNGNYISGGHLATNGMSIREFLIWHGFAYTVLQEPYGKAFVVTDNIKFLKK